MKYAEELDRNDKIFFHVQYPFDLKVGKKEQTNE